MKTYIQPLMVIMILGLFNINIRAQVNTDKYLWEYPSHLNVDPPEDLVLLLRNEIQQILDTGFLRPLSIRYTDQMWETYLIYREPARIMQTLAEAYPLLDSSQKTSLISYVHQLFSEPEQQFWIQPSYSNRFLPSDYGIERQFYPTENVYASDSWGIFRPTIQLIYQFWNYSYRTGDSSLVFQYYDEVRDFYELKMGYQIDPGNLYGTMCAHIGMARLARMMNDQPTINLAKANLEEFLVSGLNLSVIDSLAYQGKDGWNAPYPAYCDGGEYCYRKDDMIHRGFIFLNLSPEIGRFLKDHVYEQTLARHNYGLNLFPFWWLVDAPHFARWAGDESVGIPSEMFGMVMPIEKWVKNSTGEDVELYFSSAPKGIGDCFWLEGLTLALEAYGSDDWKDIRNQPFTFEISAGLPVITLQPSSLQALEGSDVSFSTAAQGSGTLTYEWYGPDGLIENSNTTTLVLENAGLGSSGKYYCRVSNGFGSVTSDTAILTVYLQQTIQLSYGWSGISLNVIPLDTNVENMFNSISDQLIILQNGNQIYWPEQQINTMINWNPLAGYLLKVSDASQLVLNGVPLNVNTRILSTGWNLFPVSTPCSIESETIANLLGDGLIIIMEAAGYRMYWPKYGINTLPELEPGKSYWILMNHEATLVYPACNAK